MGMCHKHTKPWQEVDKEDCPYCKIADYERTDMLGLQAKVERLEKFHKAVRNAYYAPPMEAAPMTDHDHRQVSRGVCAALTALEDEP